VTPSASVGVKFKEVQSINQHFIDITKYNHRSWRDPTLLGWVRIQRDLCVYTDRSVNVSPYSRCSREIAPRERETTLPYQTHQISESTRNKLQPHPRSASLIIVGCWDCTALSGQHRNETVSNRYWKNWLIFSQNQPKIRTSQL